METKGKSLKASMALRSCDDELFNNIYFTSDLTEKQRDETFKLRQEKRFRMTDLGERNLLVKRGKLVKIYGYPEKKDGASDGHHRVLGPH